VFVTDKPFRRSVILCSSLLGPLVNYEENEVLRIQLLGWYSHNSFDHNLIKGALLLESFKIDLGQML
jgi:hypothetical protein